MRKLLVISGFSGVGKNTVIRSLMEMDPEIQLSISETDRKKRNDDDRYVFVSPKQFQENLKSGHYIEYNCYGTHYYGTPRQPVLEYMDRNPDGRMILEIDVHGVRMAGQDIDLKRLYTDIITVFIAAEAETLLEGLKGRGDSLETIRKRLEIAADEARNVKEYEYILLNRNVENTAARLFDILADKTVRSDSFDEDKFCSDISAILQTLQ